MSIIKSFSVGDGDMFYIKHGSDNFTVIDCHLHDDEKNAQIIDEIKKESKDKGISRFISTHPDEDHIKGLTKLDESWSICNFYCVENEATKSDTSVDFEKYCELRDSDKSFYIYKGCSRKWMNKKSDERGSSGISILWPDIDNSYYKEALKNAKNGLSPNNISPIIKYCISNGASILWMGDIESDFLNNVSDNINFEEVTILFAPHHGRDSGKVPSDILKILNPKIIVIGEADSKNLNYYSGYNTIKQNSAGDITFECDGNCIHIYTGNPNYSEKYLKKKNKKTFANYIGSIEI